MKPIMWIVGFIVVEILLYRFVQLYRRYTVFEDRAKQRANLYWKSGNRNSPPWRGNVIAYSTTC